MSTQTDIPQDAATADQVTGTEVVVEDAGDADDVPMENTMPDNNQGGKSIRKSINAFAELMAPKQKSENSRKSAGAFLRSVQYPGRDGLGAYLDHPGSIGPERLVYYNNDFVVLNDLYPKASVHLLILPRDLKISRQHPIDALSKQPEFLATVTKEVEKSRKLAAAELRRRFGQYSVSDKPYQEALEQLMSSPDPPATAEAREKLLPKGRDWEKDIMVGIHRHPSMNHLHIHVVSVDRHSPCVKHRKHYNSFYPRFFIPVEDFPLAKDDDRWAVNGRWATNDMKCWRCGKNFGNKFARLKEHLEEEFEEWKRE